MNYTVVSRTAPLTRLQVKITGNCQARNPILSIAILLGIFALFSYPALAGPLTAITVSRQQSVQKYQLGEWRLRVDTSAFSDDVQCRLVSRNGLGVYTANAVGFRFDENESPLAAWVKIGNAPVKRWRDFLPELAALRVPITGKNIDAPTDGIVWLPIDAVGRADRVVIQLRRDSVRGPSP